MSTFMSTAVNDEKRAPPEDAATHDDERSSSESEVVCVNGNTAKTSAKKLLDVLAATMLVVGGLNWGFIGLFQVDLVATVLGESTLLSRLVYTVVGAAAAYAVFQVVSLTAVKRRWTASSQATPKVSA